MIGKPDHSKENNVSGSPGAPRTSGSPRLFRMLDAAGLFGRGMAMGAADIVPGVSGGTIALISGVYERMIDALGSLSPAFLAPLARGRGREALTKLLVIRWGVLIPLFLGVFISDVAMSQVVPTLMEDHPGATYAFFFGLIAAAVWVPFSLMKTRRPAHFAMVFLAAMGAWIFVGMQPQGVRLSVVSSDAAATTVVYPNKLRSAADYAQVLKLAQSVVNIELTQVVVIDPKGWSQQGELAPMGFETIALADDAALADWFEQAPPLIVLEEQRASLGWVIVIGVISISAMILPGISGAFLLLFLGQYHAILSSIHGVAEPIVGLLRSSEGVTTSLGDRPWIDDALFLGAFNIGVLFGLATFARVVRWLFAHSHDVTMAALTGLMIGGLRQPAGQVQLAAVGAGEGYWLVVGGWALGGAVLVTTLSAVESRLRSRRESASCVARD